MPSSQEKIPCHPVPGLDLVWGGPVGALPVLGGLFWLIWRVRQDADRALERVRHLSDSALADMREGLADYKLEVAKNYVSIAYLKDVERRLTDHLLRIDAKLDGAALVHSNVHGNTAGAHR